MFFFTVSNDTFIYWHWLYFLARVGIHNVYIATKLNQPDSYNVVVGSSYYIWSLWLHSGQIVHADPITSKLPGEYNIVAALCIATCCHRCLLDYFLHCYTCVDFNDQIPDFVETNNVIVYVFLKMLLSVIASYVYQITVLSEMHTF